MDSTDRFARVLVVMLNMLFFAEDDLALYNKHPKHRDVSPSDTPSRSLPFRPSLAIFRWPKTVSTFSTGAFSAPA